MNYINKTANLLVVSKKTGLEVNSEETKYTFTFREKECGTRSQHKTANKFFDIEAIFKYLETTLTNLNRMHK